MTVSRIEQTFGLLRKNEKPGLITFITAGDPNLALSESILGKLPKFGADIIELGIPFSDPMADGPVIQAAGRRALASGIDIGKVFSMVSRFRIKDDKTPIVLMGYYNPIYIYGVKKFVADAEEVGVDGVIVVDLPIEENEMEAALSDSSVHFIYMIAPTTNEERLAKIATVANGFVYYVSVLGITGTKNPLSNEVETALTRIRNFTNVPIAVGFGIKTPKQASEIGCHADAAVVGSALVSCIEENLDKDGLPTPSCEDAILGLTSQLASGLRTVSR